MKRKTTISRRTNRLHVFDGLPSWLYSQQSIARKKSSDGKIEYIMASMLIVLLDVW